MRTATPDRLRSALLDCAPSLSSRWRMALDFSLSPEQQGIIARARAAFVPLAGWPARARTGEMHEAAWAALGEAGFFAAAGADPGPAGGLLGLCLALEELGAAGLPTMQPILTAAAAIAVARHGEEDLKHGLLPGVTTGTCRFCLAITAAEAGFNTFRTKTRAERLGRFYRLTGSKIYTTGADVAEAMLVLARSIPYEECVERGLPKTAGLIWLVVDPAAPGVAKREMPTRGEGVLRQFEIELFDVEIPVEDRVGGEGEGLPVLLDLIQVERALVAAMLVGAVRWCLDVASAHARERKVWGDAPIGSYQAVQHPLARAKVGEEAVRLLAWRAA